MGRKGALTEVEKSKIIQGLHKKHSTLAISKIIGRDHRTVKKFACNPSSCNGRSDKGKMRKNGPVSQRDLNLIKREVRRNPLQTSKQVLEAAGVPGVPRTSRCRVLKKIATCGKADIRPPLKDRHKKERLQWAQKYMKQPFEHVLFTDECRATLDGPDGWKRGWFSQEHGRPHLLRRQQGGGGVMFWAGIVDSELVGPFRVKDGVKMTAGVYVDFLKLNFFPWHKSQSLAFRKKFVYMHDNAPSHAARLTTEYLNHVFARYGNIMEWPPCSPDLNPIENLWSIVKRKVYSAGKQYHTKDDLWEAIVTATKEVSSDEIKKLTSSMDRRLFSVISNGGSYVKY